MNTVSPYVHEDEFFSLFLYEVHVVENNNLPLSETA